MSDWTAQDFLDQFKTQLEARPGITGLTPSVRILTYFPTPDEPLTDAIILAHTVRDSSEDAAIGRQAREDTVEIESQIRIVRPGAGEDPTQLARDRAADLLGEIDNQLRTDFPDVGTQTVDAEVARREMSQFAYHAGSTPIRVCLIDFTITYRARTPRESS